MKNRVFAAVEIKRFDMMLTAKFLVKGGGSFYPLSVQIKFRKPMVYEKIRPYIFEKFSGSQMISNRTEADPGWDAACPAEGT